MTMSVIFVGNWGQSPLPPSVSSGSCLVSIIKSRDTFGTFLLVNRFSRTENIEKFLDWYFCSCVIRSGCYGGFGKHLADLFPLRYLGIFKIHNIEQPNRILIKYFIPGFCTTVVFLFLKSHSSGPHISAEVSKSRFEHLLEMYVNSVGWHLD